MAFQFLKQNGWGGLFNSRDARDIGNGLSKAQNISLDVGGKIRTIGGLTDFTKVDGSTALTQTAKLCPGSGLKTYGSDHWRGTDTIVDLIATDASSDSAVSDQYGEVDDVGEWDALGGGTLLSQSAVADEGTYALHHSGGVSIILSFDGGVGGIPVVIGQKYKFHARSRSDSVGDAWLLGTTNAGEDIWRSNYGLGTGTWETFEIEFIASTNRVHILYYHSGSTDSYTDNVYLTAIARRDLDTNWLALADVASGTIDLYDVNSNSFSTELLDFGTVSSYIATIDKINFPTTKTITDSTSQFLNKGIQAGDIRIISGSALNNIMFVVEHVTAGTIRARGNPFVVDADDDGTITLTKYNPVAFHYVNEALRASPANGGITLRPKHYSFADRTHFEGAKSSERKFSGWYANDVGPVAPTSASAHTTNGNVATQAELVAGTGFEVGITRTADDGEWTAGTYIIAIAFKYDDGQISALYVPTTDEEFGTTIVDGDSLTLTTRGKMSASVDYDERISGGYIFCRLDESDEPWSLFADISMVKGARATLSGTYNAWAESNTVHEAYTANFKSLKLNLNSYESLAGIDPTTTVEVFTDDNAFWNTSVIARNRCFIGAPRYTAEGGALAHFRDRILYSTAGAYDTFPIDNYIDVVQGDAEDYVKLGAYGNTLLAFKESTLYLIDISDPDDAGWQMKQDANKGKYPFRGLAHPGAYFETPVGPAWCNKFGVFLYNGSEIVPLLGDKIELSEHPLAYQRYMEFATDDYVIKADDANLDMGTADFSLEFLIKTSHDYSTTYGYIINKGTGAGSYYIYIYTDNKLYWATRDSGEDIVNSDSVINDGEWHHIVCVADRDGTNKIYIDGVLQADTASSSTGTISNAEDFYIGRSNGGAYFYFGNIALVHIWNRALSAAEVLALYNGQPVLAADQWGSQTNLTTNGDWADWTGDNPDDWDVTESAPNRDVNEVGAGQGHGGAGTGYCNIYHNGGGGTTRLQQSIVTVIGATYRITIPIDTVTIQGSGLVIQDAAQTDFVETYTTTGAKIIDFTATATSITLDIIRATAGVESDYTLADISMVRTGCVAEYAPKGIGDATWTDQSDNSLD
ncbi:hypothetical protein LCGC14_1439910, partial [marine sediment metagenome]